MLKISNYHEVAMSKFILQPKMNMWKFRLAIKKQFIYT